MFGVGGDVLIMGLNGVFFLVHSVALKASNLPFQEPPSPSSMELQLIDINGYCLLSADRI